uniref:Uncharacterized protein n=1 Tax=Anguilla anguilla TaxID=7936 RepID=A0A0E9S3J5_ANGAN
MLPRTVLCDLKNLSDTLVSAQVMQPVKTPSLVCS